MRDDVKAMDKRSGKMHLPDIILCVIVLTTIVIGLILPKTGPLVLLDEFCDVLVLWFACAYALAWVFRSSRTGSVYVRTIRIIVVLACIGVCIWFSKNVVLDLTAGTQNIVLKNIEVSHTQAHTGIFSSHYYLTGTDLTGEKIRLEISGKDYTRLSGVESARAEYYKWTERVVEIHGK